MNEQTEASGGQPNILIVEDSLVEAELLRRTLTRAGYQVTIAKNGEQGLQAARARRPVLIVSDIQMPLMNGYQLCHEIKYDDELWNIPLILLTMLSEPEDIMEALNSGADGYITKPFVEAILLERISALLSTPVSRRRVEERRSETVEYNSERHTITGGSQQVLNLLLSVYENSLSQNRDLTRVQNQLNLLNESLDQQVRERSAALMKSETSYRSLFENMLNGFFYCRVLYENGEPQDFTILEVNEAFGTLTGLNGVVGRKVSEVIPRLHETNPDLLKTLGRVAKTGGPEKFEIYLKSLEMWFSVSAYCPKPEHFVAIFDVITERKKAEAALLESEDMLRSISETAPDAIILLDAVGRIASWNVAASKLFGYSKDEALGQNLHRLLAPERFHAAHETAYAQFKLTGQGAVIGKTLELAGIHKDGHEITVELSLSALKRHDGWNAVGIIRDISDRKAAEAAIERERSRLEAILKTATDGIHILDPEGLLVDANDAFLNMLGYDRTAIGRLHVYDWDVQHDEETIREIFRQLIAQHNTLLTETRQRCSDGRVIDVEINSRAIGIDGQDYIYASSRDVTERKQAQGMLQESEERYRQAMETARDAIVLVESEHATIVAWNPAAEVIFGYSKAEAIGRGIHELLPPLRFRDAAQRGMAHFASTGEGAAIGKTLELAALHKNGMEFPIELSLTAMQIGGKWYATGTARDITERKRNLERTTALLELTTLAQTLDEKALLQRGLDTMQHLTGSRIAFLHFVSEDQNEVELAVWSTDTLASFCQTDFNRHYPVSDAGIWADCIGQKQAIIINNYATAPGRKGYPEGHADVQRFISVPIFDGTQVRMIVGVGNSPTDYGEHDVETVKLFSYDLYRVIQHMRAEKTIHASEERYHHLFENMSNGVAIYQSDATCEVFNFKTVNSAVERIEQVKREDLIGLSLEEVFPGVRAMGLLAVFQRVCRSGEAEHLLPTFYQDERIAGWRENYVYRLDSGEVVVVYDDVTERVESDKRIAEQLDELRRWNEATLGREMRAIELKREVNELLGQAGQPPRYPSAEAAA